MSLFDRISQELKPQRSIFDTIKETLYGSEPTPITRNVEPDPNGIRVKSNYNLESTSTANSTAPTSSTDAPSTLAIPKVIAQGTARSGAAVGLELVNKIGALSGKEYPTLKDDPTASSFERNFQRILFGEEEPESLSTQFKKGPERAEELGFPKYSSELLGGPLAVGLTALDFIGGGGKKEVVETLAKLTKAEDIAKLLRQQVRSVPDGLVDDLAKTLETVSDPAQVKTLLDDTIQTAGTGKLRADVIPPARKVTTSDGFLTSSKEPGGPRLTPAGQEMKDISKERGFITTVKESANAADEVKAKIASQYNPITNAETLAEAKKIIEANRDTALGFARSESEASTPLSNAVAQLLIIDAQKADRWQEAIDLVETTARRVTNPAQALQSLSMFNRLSPEGVLRYAQRTIEKANKSMPAGKRIKITEAMAEDVVKTARKIEKMEDGAEKAVETAVLLNKIHAVIPVGLWKKIAMTQTIFQLLNPKTITRNVIGNIGFGALENVSDVAASLLDSPLSLLTGKRSKVMPNIPAQLKGFKEGFQSGVRDALAGVDTMGLATHMDIPKTPIFKGRVGMAAEKTLNVVLKSFDRASYKAAYDGSLYNQMKAANVLEPTEVMKEVAHFDGLYRTFQDDNALSYAFSAIKKGLNGGKDFGIGDIILKYPRTPANLLARGLAYSPAGFFNTVYEAARPLIGKEFNQKAFVESFGRALVGSSALVGTGALLHRTGIITGGANDDKDINAIERMTGLGQYKINVSAMKRFVLSGMDVESAKIEEGDTLVSYDWFQPAAIDVSIGANIDEGATSKSLITTLVEGVSSGIDTIAEQPLVQGLTRFLKYGDASDAVVKSAQQIPSSFVPTLLNQVRQLVDNTRRNVYSPDTVQYALNLAKSRIPGQSDNLQPLLDTFGQEQDVYQNASNNLFNVFLNPAFVSHYKLTPEAKLVLDLYNSTGDVKQAPRISATKQVVNGERVTLGPKKVTEMQRFVGTATKRLFHSFATDPAFQALSPDDKIKYMSNVMSDIGSAAKIVLLGDRPKKPSQRTMSIVNQYLAR